MQRPGPRSRECHRCESLRDRVGAPVFGHELGRQPFAGVGCDRGHEGPVLERPDLGERPQDPASRIFASPELSGNEREQSDPYHPAIVRGARSERAFPLPSLFMADPVSWLQIEQGWNVVTSDGVTIGTVAQVEGDKQDDIFDGLAVSPSRKARDPVMSLMNAARDDLPRRGDT